MLIVYDFGRKLKNKVIWKNSNMLKKFINKPVSAIIFSFLFGVTGIYAATYTVDNRLDAGAGSLRQAIINANNTPEDDIINFNPLVFNQPRTITLLSGELYISGSGTTIINAPGADLLTVTAEGSGRMLSVNGGRAIISGINFTRGRTDSSGGAIRIGYFFNDGGSLELINSRVTDSFVENYDNSQKGGGIYNNGNLIVRNSIIADNSVKSRHARGGGIGHYSGLLTLVNSTVSGNYADEDGGGLYLESPARIENSLISGNGGFYTYGGGILVSNNDTTIINSTISGNSASDYGGILVGVGSTMRLFSSTVAFNGSGGGIYNASTADKVFVRNSVIAKNRIYGGNPSAGESDFYGTFTSQGYNLIGSTTNTSITGDTTGNILNADPLLAALADNGGATLTHKPLAGSPLIDAGDPLNFPQFDGRGFLRPADGDGDGISRTDIGAVELNANPTQTGNFTGRITSGTKRTNLTAMIYLIGKNGFQRQTRANAFGYFRFNDLPTNQSYVVYFQAKAGTIPPKTISINTTEGVIEF